MGNYNNAKIYKIYSVETGLCYVGSTCQDLTERMRCHKKDYNRYLNGKSNYVSSFEVLETNDYKIELIEDFPCNDRKELQLREGYFIRSMECVNKVIAGRTDKEYYKENQNKFKEYYQNNKDIQISKAREYRQQNKDKIKANKKEYYQTNKDIINENSKKYQQQNKDKIKEYKKEYYQRTKWKKKFNICLNELLTQ